MIIIMITLCLIPELISDLDGLIPEVKVAGVALCGEVWLKPLLISVIIIVFWVITIVDNAGH